MAVMTHEKFNFNRLMITFIFGIRAWRMTEKAWPYRVKILQQNNPLQRHIHYYNSYIIIIIIIIVKILVSIVVAN